MRKFAFATLAFALVATSATYAAQDAQPDGAGVVRYAHPGTTPTLACAPLEVCTVMLQNGESILNVATGDSVRWIVAEAASGPGGSTPLVLVKPKEFHLHTNLVVTTTKHVYYVALVSSDAWHNGRIGFFYPAEEAEALAAATRANLDAERLRLDEAKSALPNAPPERLDRAYRITGKTRFTPQSVYSDGVHTYVEFAPLPTDLPILIAVAPDGSDQILNYRLLGNTYVVDGVPAGIDLILNAGTGRRGRGESRVIIRHT